MVHQVFVCHSSADRDSAVAVVEAVEARGVPCWIAPRNVPAGRRYAQAITDAITESRIVLVLLSANANTSDHVLNEINTAVDRSVPLLPVNVDGAAPSKTIWFYLGTLHVFDAAEAPLASHLDHLAETVQQFVGPNHTAPIDADAVHLDELRVEPAAARAEPPPRPLPASPQVSRKKPICLLMLVDQSASMHHRIAGLDVSKKVAVADTVNRVLYNAILNSTKEDGVRHYFDVGILGYGVADGVASAFADELVPIDWVADNPRRFEKQMWEEDDGKGGIDLVEEDVPVWFEPYAKGKTLMRAAFAHALPMVRAWIAAHQASFPPIVLNITDGGYSDGDPTPLAREIQELSTTVGNALVLNCHLSETVGQTLMFPSPHEVEQLDARSRVLHDMSSPLPEPMRAQAVALGYRVESGAHGYVRNADLASLTDFLDIGTRPVQDGAAGA